MLVVLGFDLTCPGTVAFIDRYLHLLKLDDIPVIHALTEQICKFALIGAHLLEYRPSQLAASACILNINIFRRDQELHESKNADKIYDQLPNMIQGEEKIKYEKNYSKFEMSYFLHNALIYMKNQH